jgi:cell division protein FtsB
MAKKKKEKINYTGFFVLITITAVLVFLNVKLWNERKVTKEQLQISGEELERISYEKEEKESKIQVVDMEEKIERVAREQLLLKKEGENVIVISRVEDTEYEEEHEEETEKGFFESLIEVFTTQ